jgi:acetoacetyl-CoA synthetase
VTAVREGDLLWTPSKARRDRSHVLRFMQWLKAHRGLHLESYDALWHWSVTDLESFWHSIWDYFGVQASVPFERVLGRRSMPGAQWFPGARLNYAGHILARERPGATAIISVREGEPLRRMSWETLGQQVRILAT